MTLTSKQHDAISLHCVEAMDGYYDQHVYDAMMYHDGEGLLARIAEDEDEAARKARRAAPPKSRRRSNDDPLGFFAALRKLRQGT